MFDGMTLALVLAFALIQETGQTREKIAEQELRNAGVAFREISLAAIFLTDPRTKAEYDRLRDGNMHIVIDDAIKLGRQRLKYLGHLPKLKEVIVGPDFPDEWYRDLESLTQLEGLFIRGEWALDRGLTDKGLASVAKLCNLKALSVLDTRITDDGIRHIQGLTKLRYLMLTEARYITNKGVERLQNLTNLEVLFIDGTKTDAEAVAYLKNLTKLREIRLSSYLDPAKANLGFAPKTSLKVMAKMLDLRKLDARGLSATDEDLQYIRNMKKLKELNLCYTNVSDKGLQHLASLESLEELDLFGTGVCGDGLKYLRKLKKLKHLVLGFCPLDDRAVPHLRQMTHLKYLEVGDTKLSRKAIDELKRSLPKTKIR